MNDVVGYKDHAERSGFVAMVDSNMSHFVISSHRDKVRGKTTRRTISQGYGLIFIGMVWSTSEQVHLLRYGE